jgi:predicted component of type VI protein secretion system
MKLSLSVLSTGKSQGKSIPIARSPFVIGRDPSCHLRPNSPLISNRHCAILVRGGKVFLRDFESTNGTTVDDQAVKGEVELHDGQRLQVGPLAFRVAMSTSPAVDQPTPLPPTKTQETEDEAAAALLLSSPDDASPSPASVSLDPTGVPTGTTIMLPPEGTPPAEGQAKPEPAKAPSTDTSTSAKAILEKYLRRTRG